MHRHCSTHCEGMPVTNIQHTHPFNGPLSGTTRVNRYQKDKTNLDFAEARDSEWQWHQLGHMQVCTSLQTDNHSSTPTLSFLQAGCPSCRPTNSVKALKAITNIQMIVECMDARHCKTRNVSKTRLTMAINLGFYLVFHVTLASLIRSL